MSGSSRGLPEHSPAGDLPRDRVKHTGTTHGASRSWDVSLPTVTSDRLCPHGQKMPFYQDAGHHWCKQEVSEGSDFWGASKGRGS